MTVPSHARTAKIVATIGPASWELDLLKQLLDAGVDVVRINAAHNTIETRHTIVETIRTAASETGRHVAILQDLAGPKPRTGPLPNGDSLALRRGELIQLVPGDDPLELGRISIDDERLVDQLQVGQRVLFSDGLIETIVEDRHGGFPLVRVVRSGQLRGRQGVTVPGAVPPPRTITPEESEDIRFAAESNLEYLGVSFVTSPQDVQMVRDELHRFGGRSAIIAKIERPEALGCLGEVARISDAIMVARGDLGVQLAPEDVPIAQKRIIEIARHCGTPVITATQMLESMITQPIPTRAETSDVANAVLDSTDAVMLSAETATGDYPLEAVEIMDRVIVAVERAFPPVSPVNSDQPKSIASTIARAATDIARRSPLVDLIAVFTRSGFSAREVARERPAIPIVALTNNEFVANQLALLWGTTALVAPFASDTESLIADMTKRLLEAGYARPGNHVLFVGSLTVHDESGHTNLLHLRKV